MYLTIAQLLTLTSLIFSPCQASTILALNEPTAITTIDLQSSGPSVKISPSIGAISIEFCYITDYLGFPQQPNLLSLQLLQNIQDRTGTSPVIRIGGDTQDVARFCPNCTATLTNIFNPGNTEAISVTFGQGLFRVLNENVPSTQEFVFGLNLAGDNVEFPLAEVAAAIKYLQPERLKSFELGNEPDYYSVQRPDGWNVDIYAEQVTSWIAQIQESVGEGKVKWQLGAIAHPPIYMGNFSLVELGILGVEKQLGTGAVTSLSDHTYPFSLCDPKSATEVSLPNLMSHMNTIQYFSQWSTEIAAAKAQSIPFVMGETGSVSCHGKLGVSNTLGAALWEIDYMLHAAMLGMESVYFHSGTAFHYSMWQPVAYNNTPATVWPTYYSFLFIADTIGNISSPNLQEVSALESDTLALYGLYSGNVLQKIVALNLEFFNVTTPRPEAQSIDVSSILGQDLNVRRLTGSSSDVTGNVTWAAQSFDTGLAVGDVTVESSTGVVRVGASEAVIIERRLSSRTY